MKATTKLLTPYNDSVLRITTDYGKEFAHHEQISKVRSTEFDDAHPYRYWERDLNGSTNGLLRQDFPNSIDFKVVDQAAVKRAVSRLNSRPRKNLRLKNPVQLTNG
ncbi:IS30 family transposase [Zhongshania sp.]|uniref:IS30 family transposase n=1 Tax=Zhongshania sp. TaxID=1971902 RepID=UPI00356A253B